MKLLTLTAVTVGLALMITPLFAEADAKQQAAARYEEYLQVLDKAQSIDEIYPYWAGWMEKGASGRSEAEKQERLERLQDDARARAQRSQRSGVGTKKKVTLTYSAIDGDWNMVGTVAMIWQKSVWRIDEEIWTSE